MEYFRNLKKNKKPYTPKCILGIDICLIIYVGKVTGKYVYTVLYCSAN